MTNPSSRAGPSWPAVILLALFAILVVVQLAARAFYGVSLHDQADLVLFAQNTSLVFDEQVPIYGLLLGACLRLTGWAVWAPDALKLAFLGVAMWAAFDLGKALSESALAGLTASLTLFLVPTVYDDVLREATHTTAVIAFALLSHKLALRPPGSRLGVVWGLGLLAKYNMGAIAMSQVGARWGVERRRPGRGAIVAGLLAACIAMPAYALLFLDVGAFTMGTAEFTKESGGRWRGLADLPSSVLTEGALLLLFLGVSYWRLRRGGGTVRRDETMLLASVPIVIGLYAALIVVGDVGVVRDRWFAPSLVVIGPVAAAWLARATGTRAQRVVATVFGALLLTLIGYRATQSLYERGVGQNTMQARPYARIADVVAERAGSTGVQAILFADDQLAATTKVRHPSLMVFGGRTQHRVPVDAARLLLVGSPSGVPIGRPEDWTITFATLLDCGPVDRASYPYRFGNDARYDVMVRVCSRR